VLFSIGKKSTDAEDLVGALAACHARIRSACATACAIAESGEDAREESEAVRRYLTEALPLHVTDEDESLAPRLRGKDPTLDATLARLAADHHAHEELVAAVVDALERGDRGALRRAAPVLRDALETHLVDEETNVFPAIRAHVGTEEEAAVRAEMKQRRER
jgi:iron-sulfur cluster repair protein YtfE (RIC family)